MAARAPLPGTTPNSNAEKARRKAIRVNIKGESYVLRIGELTPKHARLFRSVTGHSLDTSLSTDEPGTDTVTLWIWLVKLINGERSAHNSNVAITLDEIDDAYTYEDFIPENGFSLVVDEEVDDEDADPLASDVS